MEKETYRPLEPAVKIEQELPERREEGNGQSSPCPGIKKKGTFAYNQISNETRGELLQRVLVKKEKLADVTLE